MFIIIIIFPEMIVHLLPGYIGMEDQDVF